MLEAREQYERIIRSIIDIDKFGQIQTTRNWIMNFGSTYNNEEAMKSLLSMLEYKNRCLVLGIGQVF